MLHRRRELRGQLPTAQMDAQQCARETAVARKRRDLMDVPAGPSKIGQAEMTKRVRRESEDARDASDRSDRLRPRPDAERTARVSVRHRQEQWTARSADGSPFIEVRRVELPGRWRVWDHSLTPTLCMFRTDADQAVSRINVRGIERDELLAPQCRVVRQRKHEARAYGRLLHHAQDFLPLLLRWDPREPPLPPDQRASPGARP